MLTQSFVNCADVSNEEFQISPHLWQSCKEGAVLRRHANNKGCARQQFLCCQSKVSGRCFGVIWRRGVSGFAFNAGKFALTLMLLWCAKPTSKPSFCRIRYPNLALFHHNWQFSSQLLARVLAKGNSRVVSKCCCAADREKAISVMSNLC